MDTEHMLLLLLLGMERYQAEKPVVNSNLHRYRFSPLLPENEAVFGLE